MEILQNKIFWKKRGHSFKEVPSSEALLGKEIVMLYFGCSSCELHFEFLPVLKDIYEVITTHNLPIEVIYTSTERNINTFKTHFLNDHGDWLTIPCGDETHLLLECKYEVSSIPRAIVISKLGSIITMNAYREMLSKGRYSVMLWLSPFM